MHIVHWNGLMQIVAESVSGVGDWSGYPLDCGAKKGLRNGALEKS